MKNNLLKTKLGMRFISVLTMITLLTATVTGCGKIKSEEIAVTDEVESNELQAVMEKQAGLAHTASGNMEKEEVVYILADANGNANEIIVSDWLKNTNGEGTIVDTSNLTNITNVSGDEDYTIDEDGNLVWNAKGNDIHYQGTSTATLPVDVSITYFLDGEEITPDDIVGKSGKVTIRFDYTNNEMRTVSIGGEEKDIYVPFTMMSGTILDNSHFTNISVTNGRIVSSGDSNIVIGMAFPGLSDSLDIASLKDKLSDDVDKDLLDDTKIPDYVEISADVVDFQMSQTMTMAFSDVLSSLNFDSTIEFDTSEITDSMDELSDGVNQLSDGSVELNDGAIKLSDGAYELADGAKQIDDGAGKLNDGALELDNGASALLDGANQLNSGAGELTDGIIKVNDGVSTLKDGANQLNNGAGELKNGADKLADGTSTLASSVDSLPSSVAALYNGASTINAGLSLLAMSISSSETDVQNLIIASNNLVDILSKSSITTTDMSAEIEAIETDIALAQSKKDAAQDSANYYSSLESDAQSKLDSLIAEGAEQSEIDAQQAAVDGYHAAVDMANNVISQCDSSISALQSAESGINAATAAAYGQSAYYQQQVEALASGISTGLNSLYNNIYGTGSNGNPSVMGALNQLTAPTAMPALVAGLNMLLDGTNNLKDGVNELNTGAHALADGASTLKNGTSDLADGAQTLKDGTEQLVTGANTLRDGTKELADGTQTLKDGTSELKNGTSDLKDGTTQLVDGAETLYDGTLTLSDGTEELMEGMFKFREEGIDKLTELFGDDVQDVIDLLDAVMDAGKDYHIFSEANTESANVKFIYKTEAIK